MVNKNVFSCLLKDGREVDAVTLVGRLFHACATVTRNDRLPMVLSRVRGTIRRGQEPDRSRCRDSATSFRDSAKANYVLCNVPLHYCLLYMHNALLTKVLVHNTYVGIQTLGKNAVVCGRSKNVGLPIALLLHADGAGETEACECVNYVCRYLSFFISFLPCDAVPAQYMLSAYVCLSIRLSQAGTVPQWLNVGSRKQCHSD